MNKVFCFLLVLGVSTVGEGREPAKPRNVEFEGRRFVLVHSEKPQGTSIDGYVPEGETMKNWSSLILVGHIPQIPGVLTYAEEMIKLEGSMDVQKPRLSFSRKPGEDPRSATLEQYLLPEQRNEVYYQLTRVTVDDTFKGVKYVRFMTRSSSSVESAVSTHRQLYVERCTALFKVATAVFETGSQANDSDDEDSDNEDSDNEDSDNEDSDNEDSDDEGSDSEDSDSEDSDSEDSDSEK